ncbi:hypothetical protein P775_00390 [Puniceibacterium antarcticum]|uniref:Glycosyltransferase 2-like domain-containing protein n=1 Tax=Puniceibacterium antarcticum TaxID=1206336 RepID=A0A2G8RKY2_9RHOB|nr:glycosyltransferase family 2 protein [Puniceibacterium antarcticum]PIL22217.1 hypothetical protein P775_00390 [Puniceibacterium antarcticum]
MRLSIIVIFHDMKREAARTLYSLSTAYQRDVDPEAYEVIAVDNGSTEPLTHEFVASFGPQFQLIRHETQSVSPVEAVNLGVEAARGNAVAIIIDGARMATPGLVGYTLHALGLGTFPVVYALAWHLGPDVQNKTVPEGYNQATEDALLEKSRWREDGYALFDISTLAQSSGDGFLGKVPPEFSWVALPRDLFDTLGGYDIRFQTPGGGLVNHHFRDRALSHPGITLVALLGEGLFHQVHGGVATNVPMKNHPIGHFRAEYRTITGEDYTHRQSLAPLYVGHLPKVARPFL